ncbi:amino acid adenylation domain-containing protein [Streptomyces macrosporus]|uniref:Carrier domain-containing protein n=1 Tax=Streptomyces macrosporus TaxID=44032 RepID=A0ABN3KMR4_9ACTN
MTVLDLLKDLSDRGIRLSAKGDTLAVSAPDGVLTERIRTDIRNNRQQIVQFLREYAEEQARRRVTIERIDRGRPIPASYAQQRLWLVEQTATELPVYNMYFATELTGKLDVDALKGAAQALIDRHEVLRTALRESESGLLQHIDEHCRAVFEEHEASADDLDEVLLAILSTRFDLAKPPLIHFHLVRTGEERWIFVVKQHHVISDGWSTGIIKKELSELYSAGIQGKEAELPQLTVQYADYAAWERHWLGTELAGRQRDYWREALADLPPLLDLVPSRKREAVQSYGAGSLTFHYDREFLDRARSFCAEAGTTLYSLLVAAYSLLLSRMSRCDDIAVGSPLANRPYPALEGTLGLFFNSITIRSRIDDRRSVREYLAATRRTAYEAFAHQDLPFDQVVQIAAPDRSSSHSPVFQNVFILQTYPGEDLTLPGVRAVPASTPVFSAQYDLTLKLREDDDGMQGLLTYNNALLDASDAGRLVVWYRQLVEQMCANPDARVGDLQLMDPDSAERIARWNRETARDVPDVPVHEQIGRRLVEDPDAVAVRFRGRRVSRGELAATAEAVAAGLQSAGLPPGTRVGVMVPRSPELPAVLLGVLRAGMTYVPLDGTAPEGRLEYMLESARCAALITDDRYAERCPGYTGHRLALAELLHTTSAPVPTEPADSAYVIFTSGTTGKPKGVEVTHGNLANLFVALDEAVPLPRSSVWLSVTAVTFDIAVVELLWTLYRGVPVVLAETAETLSLLTEAPEQQEAALIPELILGEGVTALQATPTLLRGMLRLPDAERALASLRLLMVGGEALDPTLAAKLKELGIRRVLNMYGPTETTVWSTCWEVPDEADRILVGRPLANTVAHIVDSAWNPLPVGMFGELVIAGAGVARGYTGNPELTKERFLQLPAVHGEGAVYRTGDIARWLPTGEIELLGRVDNQVKVNGYRIELEEVEQAINSLGGVAESAVVVQRHGDRDVLVAHCVPEDPATFDAAELRVGLSRLLPHQMVPAVFVTRDALPTTTSGKTDRNALPRVAPTAQRTAAPTSPAGGLEERLLKIWRRLLDNEQLSVTDDFFRVGGNSLLVARLLTEVRAEIDPDARIVDLFRHPTIRGYAAHLSDPGGAGAAPGGPDPTAAGRHTARLERRQQVARKRRLRRPRDGRG